MSIEPAPRRKGRSKYTVVFVPSDQSKKSASFSISKSGIFGSIIATFFVIVITVLAVVVYTPLGAHLPIATSQLERVYGQKVTEIQNKLVALVNQVNEVQMYNLKLRKALGERMAGINSAESTSVNKIESIVSKKAPVDQQWLDYAVEAKSTMPQQQEFETEQTQQPVMTSISDFFPLTMPTIGYRSRGFDVESNHLGLDIVGTEGNPVVASASGTVIFADWTADDGLMMVVLHGDGYTTIYKHNEALLKSKGSVVKRGEPIALLGNTGRTSTGPHLHFEVWNNGQALNPINYLITIQ